MSPSATGKTVDRRTRYTKSVIKESFFDLLREKGFAKMSVTDICKASEINRGTFYLHYEDKYALLDEVIDEALDTEPPLDGTTPSSMCQKAPVNDDHRLLYTMPELFNHVTQRVIQRGAERAIPEIMSRTGLSEEDASVIFVFTAQGNLAVNRILGWERTEEFERIQRLTQTFIEGGYKRLKKKPVS